MSTEPVEGLPAAVLDAVARTAGTEASVVGRFSGSLNAGAVRVRLAGRADAVLKAAPRTRASQLDETLRAWRIVEHMRGRGYPTPASPPHAGSTTWRWPATAVTRSARPRAC